jgi:hypothetical protein
MEVSFKRKNITEHSIGVKISPAKNRQIAPAKSQADISGNPGSHPGQNDAVPPKTLLKRRQSGQYCDKIVTKVIGDVSLIWSNSENKESVNTRIV